MSGTGTEYIDEHRSGVYSQRIGRVGLGVYPDHRGGARLYVLDGYNESCQVVESKLSEGELLDLQYMIGRAIAALKEDRRPA